MKPERVPIGATGRVAILGMGILPAIASGTVSVMLPSITDAFGDGHNGIWIKSVATAVGLGMMVGSPVSGLLLDRFGRRVVLLTAATLFGLLGCGIMLMTQLWQIIVARFFIGLVSSALAVGGAALIGDRLEARLQSRWLGFNAGGAVFLVLLISPLVGALADIGWRYGFAIYALAIPVLISIAVGVPAGDGKHTGERPRTRLTLRRNEIRWRALALAVFMGTMSMGTALYWPFRLREVGVVHARDIALYGLPNIILSGGAALAYGIFRRYLSVTRMFVLGACFSAVGLAAVAMAGSPIVILLGLAVEGLAIGMMTPNLTTFALMGSSSETRGRVVGFTKGALYGSPFLSQFILEPIAVTHGTAAALWTIAALAATIAIVVACGALGIVPKQADAVPRPLPTGT